MKKYLIFLLSFCVVLTASAQEKNRMWTENERMYLLNGLDTTRTGLLNEIEGLTQEQMFFKPDSTSWSVAEVLEHLGVWEELLLWDLFSTANSPERRDLLTSKKIKDSIVLAYATDPAKGSSPLIALPLGRFTTRDELINYFSRFRSEVINTIRSTQADYRLHYIYRPKEWGDAAYRDLHQYTLLFISHTTRHANQVRRVKAHPFFPK